jgi:hypothetical protein
MVAPPSLGEAQQLLNAPKGVAAQFNQAQKALAGQNPRGLNGRFISPKGETPLQQLNQHANKAISTAQRFTDQTVRALGGTPLGRGNQSTNRAPQQTVADRRQASRPPPSDKDPTKPS